MRRLFRPSCRHRSESARAGSEKLHLDCASLAPQFKFPPQKHTTVTVAFKFTDGRTPSAGDSVRLGVHEPESRSLGELRHGSGSAGIMMRVSESVSVATVISHHFPSFKNERSIRGTVIVHDLC
jgi:hypothetical protein